MLAYLSVSSLLTVFPRRFFIRRNSRSAIRSRSRSPPQVSIADAVGAANIRNSASLTRRDLSRSRTFAARPLVFVNIGNLACSSSFPLRRRSEGGNPALPSENTYLDRPFAAVERPGRPSSHSHRLQERCLLIRGSRSIHSGQAY